MEFDKVLLAPFLLALLRGRSEHVQHLLKIEKQERAYVYLDDYILQSK